KNVNAKDSSKKGSAVQDKKSLCCCDSTKLVPFWSGEAIKQSFGCLIFIGIVMLLVCQKPLIGKIKPEWAPNPELPSSVVLGAELNAPANPANPDDFYGGARPEWSFRALYYMSNLKYFPGERKFIPIFVIPSCLALYCFLLPFIGRVRINRLPLGHIFNVLLVLGLFGVTCFWTYKSYEHDWELEDYQKEVKVARENAERVVELALGQGLSQNGALALMHSDPKIQGPLLYERHCASCHPFKPLEGEELDPDFAVIACENPSAPNLYKPNRVEWIEGFLDFDKLTSDDHFGKTAFNMKPDQPKDEFHAKMYDYAKGLPMRIKAMTEDLVEEKLEEHEDQNNELPEDEQKEFDEDAARKEITAKLESDLHKMIRILEAESKLDAARKCELGEKKVKSIDGISLEDAEILDTFGCLTSGCHQFYSFNSLNSTPGVPDLSGYMSRKWMIDFIADPTAPHFYGANNDRMPVYHKSEDDSTMSMQEIETLVDWLRGKWYRPEAAGTKAEAKVDAEATSENI
ncbi:MAG: hypothetical protein ACRC2T_18555, partial [Thermoguttaceae bacterium]